MDATVLVVDDEADIRSLIRLMLRRVGYRVLEAGNGAEALEVLKNAKPDVVLLDLRFPKEQGWDILEDIRGLPEWNELPVVIVSAHAQTPDLVRVKELGCGFLRKPFYPEELVEAIRSKLSEG